jgi:hypothetical protein
MDCIFESEQLVSFPKSIAGICGVLSFIEGRLLQAGKELKTDSKNLIN